MNIASLVNYTYTCFRGCDTYTDSYVWIVFYVLFKKILAFIENIILKTRKDVKD